MYRLSRRGGKTKGWISSRRGRLEKFYKRKSSCWIRVGCPVWEFSMTSNALRWGSLILAFWQRLVLTCILFLFSLFFSLLTAKQRTTGVFQCKEKEKDSARKNRRRHQQVLTERDQRLVYICDTAPFKGQGWRTFQVPNKSWRDCSYVGWILTYNLTYVVVILIVIIWFHYCVCTLR